MITNFRNSDGKDFEKKKKKVKLFQFSLISS